LQRAATRRVNAPETKAARREHRHAVNAPDDSYDREFFRRSHARIACAHGEWLARGRQRPKPGALGLRPTECSPGAAVFHDLRGFSSLEPDQLSLANRRRKRLAWTLAESNISWNHGTDAGHTGFDRDSCRPFVRGRAARRGRLDLDSLGYFIGVSFRG